MGILGDIEIHFTHYKSDEEALSKWNRRTKRMLQVTDKNNYYFKMCDVKFAGQEEYKQFHNLPFKNKISFRVLKNKNLDYNNHIGIHKSEKNDLNRGPDGLQLFKISNLYFDIAHWLSKSKVKRTLYKT